MSLFLKVLWYNQRIIVYPHGFRFLMYGEPSIKIPWVPYEDVELLTKDKIKLRCYLIPHSSSSSPRGTVIIFHGNAMNHGDIVNPHALIFRSHGFNVLTAEYRGYGLSEGTPSESGLRLDAQAAFDFVDSHQELSQLPIVIFGQSLGGAVAIDVASRNACKISALIVENTFSSIPHILQQWGIIGHIASFLATQKWWSASKLAGMPPSLPILMLSGLRDKVIPPGEMEELWEVAKVRKPKRNGTFLSMFRWSEDSGEEYVTRPAHDVFETFSGGGHADTCFQFDYWTKVIDFLDKVVPSPR